MQFKLWGWIHLNLGSIGNMMDDDVWDLLNAALETAKVDQKDFEPAKQAVLELIL